MVQNYKGSLILRARKNATKTINKLKKRNQRNKTRSRIMKKQNLKPDSIRENIAQKIQSKIRFKTMKKVVNTIADANHKVQILSDDDDCVCVEPTLGKITLDDTFQSSLLPAKLNTDQITEFQNPILFLDSFSSESAQENISASNMELTDSSGNSGIIDLDDGATNAEIDDSVIFVNETTNITAPSFIPLESDDVPNPIQFPVPKTRKKRAYHGKELFTKRERTQLMEYNNNTYNPTEGVTIEREKRDVLIDGSNVAFGHGLNKEFSVKGLTICLDFFSMKGHQVKAIVPQFRLQRNKSTNPEELEKLHRAGKIVFTPCKALPGKMSTSYDDRFILQLACQMDAVIVSNDNYRDLIHENSAFKKIIENRVVGYTWCNDIFMLPKDPYGKFGPSLQSILNSI